MFYDAAGRLRSLLASWTDVAEPDVFIQVAAGRSSCGQMIWQPWRR
nr:hypothetical protein [Mesorhizobium sp.]